MKAIKLDEEGDIRGGIGNSLLYKREIIEKSEIRDAAHNKFLVSICDMYFFDKNDNFLFKTTSLLDFKTFLNCDDPYIQALDVTYNEDYVRLQSGIKMSNKIESDLEIIFNSNSEENISIKKNSPKDFFKIIVKFELRGTSGQITDKIKYLFNNCEIRDVEELESSSGSVSGTNIKIYVKEDKDGYLYYRKTEKIS